MFLSSSLHSFSLRDMEELSFPLCNKEGGSSSLSIASKETLLPSLQQERRSSSSLFAASKEELKGEVISRMSAGTILIQDAIGEKSSSTLFGSFIVALTKGWLLSLVLMSRIPLIAATGAAMSLVIFKSSNSGQKAYAQAGTMVEHTVGSIRTLQETHKLNKSYKATVGEGTASGFRMGVVIFILFCSYGLAVWYDAKLIIEKGYDGRTIFNFMIAVTTGGMSLGQASPCLSSFASGQAAAYQMLETIN
ncbi:hypothetical protein ZIOFF_016931 [Zingiber officinale]|uniref:ABC transmembrane type-1 domain-containing protein n=1 Tax=Zingiber officinale TaxID=94328 RepID=A0A8J5HN16_ZINOF|nr:hypothetical protein ZIOFF_016931 [Zingiber officinale]